MDAADSTAAALWARLQQVGRSAGLAEMGVAPATPLEPARSVLPVRKAAGLAGAMQFTYRNPDRSTDPQRSMAGAASLVVAAWPYRRRLADEAAVDEAGTGAERPVGRVANYAWRDHYGDLRRALEPVAESLRADGYRAEIHLDDNHLVDRNVAYTAGLGWYGKNANLLLPGAGSWYVLGSIVTDAALPPTGPPPADGCGPCRRCIDDCPTAAIVAPGVVDARRCLAWIVQGPGEIPEEFREAVGGRLYGCDDCQEVCPPNLALDDPPLAEADADPMVDLLWLLGASDDELMARIGRWYIADRNPDIVRRTALVNLGNIGDPTNTDVVATIERYQHCGVDLLEDHADWAARRLGLGADGLGGDGSGADESDAGDASAPAPPR